MPILKGKRKGKDKRIMGIKRVHDNQPEVEKGQLPEFLQPGTLSQVQHIGARRGGGHQYQSN